MSNPPSAKGILPTLNKNHATLFRRGQLSQLIYRWLCVGYLRTIRSMKNAAVFAK